MTPSDIYKHLPRLVSMVETLDAQHVIELGTRSGVSTVAFLHALAGTGGRLTSVDVDAAPELGAYEHWRFVRGDDMDPAVVAQLDMADLVFIDTSHRYEHTLAELYVYRWLVRDGGLLVLHDTQLEWPDGAPQFPAFPVRRAVEQFCAAEQFEWHEFPDCFGLGVVKVGER